MRHPLNLSTSESGARRLCRLPVFLIGLVILGTSFANPAHGACESPQYREFDFWVGHWRVENTDGETVGHNRIEKVLEGCALHESWRGRSGSVGQSFNAWDASAGQWQQNWIDNRGMVLNLRGGLDEDGHMVLEGERTSPDGQEVVDRITWKPLSGDRVRQVWEQAGADGEFDTVFNGLYVREESP